MLSAPENLSLENNYAEFRLTGQFTLKKTVDLVDEAISYCKANDIGRLLVNLTQVTGFPSPTTTQRFHFATKWASAAAGRVTVAMVAPIELIDTEHIGVTIGMNRGLQSEVFTDETEALTWLLSPR
jgi:hypothetical protein